MSKLSEIVSAIRRCSSFLLTVHKSPDGDALGSELALMLGLEQIGKTVSVQNLDPVPETYRFLPGWERIRTVTCAEGRYDALVVLDADPPRAGIFPSGYPAGVLINIDHHVTNPLEWPLSWIDPEAAAAGEMVYELLHALDVRIDVRIALCLYTSIFTDTGSFRYTNTTAKSMRIAAEMIEAGADPWCVTENVYESFAFRRLKLLGDVLAGMERTKDGRIAWVVVTDALFHKNGATSEDTDNFINFVRSAKGVEVAVLFRQTGDDQYKMSFRSKGRVDVSGFARSLGGGGHRNAAGANINGPLAGVQKLVISELAKVVAEQMK